MFKKIISYFFKETKKIEKVVEPTYKPMTELDILKMNYPLGTKIIVIPNEPNSKQDDMNALTIGEVVSYMEITKAKTPILVYKDFFNNEEYLGTSTIMYHDDVLEENLKKLTWDERYNIASHGRYVMDKKHAKTREKAVKEKREKEFIESMMI